MPSNMEPTEKLPVKLGAGMASLQVPRAPSQGGAATPGYCLTPGPNTCITCTHVFPT